MTTLSRGKVDNRGHKEWGRATEKERGKQEREKANGKGKKELRQQEI